MKLNLSLLLASTAAMTVAGAHAADLPSKKAAPASYVKICDAYGAGFFFIPGTDTCVKVGGYVRAEYQYTPGHNVYAYSPTATAAVLGTPVQRSSAQDTTGMEMRGRIDVDSRTSTPMGVARTFVRVRLANTSGIRNAVTNNNAAYTNGAGNTSPTLESALIQWAGFTFGVAPENYAFMPSMFYHSNPWAGFPNGQKQLAYTATFGGGLSATIAIEDKTEWGYTGTVATGEYINTPSTGYNLVANLRWDQPWGWAIVHGAVGNNSVRADYATTPAFNTAGNLSGVTSTYSALQGSKTLESYAVGGTVLFNLPMLAPGDKLWLTANYTKGMLGALLSGGGLSVMSSASNRRLLGGIGRNDSSLVVTSGAGTAASPYTLGTTTGWNVAAAMTHYWAANWRSNLSAGYVEINPATSTLTQWGKGRLWEATGSIIYSPAKDFDIGLELQYLNLRSNIQNPSQAFLDAGSPGLRESGWSSKLRVERAF